MATTSQGGGHGDCGHIMTDHGGHRGHHGGHRGRVNRRTAVVNGRGHEIRESVRTHMEATATTSVNSGGRGGRHGGHRGHSKNAEITAGTYDQQQQHRISAVASGQGQCPEEQHRLQQKPGMYHQLYQDCLNSELRGITNTKTNMSRPLRPATCEIRVHSLNVNSMNNDPVYGGKRPFVRAQLPGKDFDALYDTGASISIVKTSAWQKMKLRPPLLSGSVSATSASGNRMTIRGHIVVPLRIFNSVKLTKLFVCDEICSEMLLGGGYNTVVQVDL
jgi:hypothetical protein